MQPKTQQKIITGCFRKNSHLELLTKQNASRSSKAGRLSNGEWRFYKYRLSSFSQMSLALYYRVVVDHHRRPAVGVCANTNLETIGLPPRLREDAWNSNVRHIM